MKRALDVIEVPKEEQEAMFNIVASVLHLGSVNFVKQEEEVSLESGRPVSIVSKVCNQDSHYLVPEVFFRCKETRQERERSVERKPLVAGDANLTIMLRYLSINITKSINKQQITTHL